MPTRQPLVPGGGVPHDDTPPQCHERRRDALFLEHLLCLVGGVAFGDAAEIHLHSRFFELHCMLDRTEFQEPVVDELAGRGDLLGRGQFAQLRARRQILTTGPTVTSKCRWSAGAIPASGPG